MEPSNGSQLEAQLRECRKDPTEANIQVIAEVYIKDLLLASWIGNLFAVESLFLQAMQAEERRPSLAELAIHNVACIAARQGHLPILRFVHAAKRDVVRTTLGEGIICHAAELVAWPHIWAFLIDNGFLGADRNPEALSGAVMTLIVYQRERAAEALQVMIDRGFHVTYDWVHVAAQKGSADTLHVLIPHVTRQQLRNKYILQDAVLFNRIEHARILIEEGGVDVNQLPTWGDYGNGFTKPAIRRTAMHCAISDNHLDMIKLLVAKGGRTTVLDEQGQTPIQRARAAKQYAAERLLLELTPREERAGLDIKI